MKPERFESLPALEGQGLVVDNVGKSFRGRPVVKGVSLRLAVGGKRPAALPWLMLGFLTVHIAYGVGYLQGIVRFLVLRRRVRPEDVRTNR